MSAPEPVASRELASLAPSVKLPKLGNGGRVVENGASTPADASFDLFGDDGFSFFDLVDIVNPLQHIPIVSSMYRHLTDDSLDAAPRLLGGALFGGTIGAVAALVNVIVDEATGRDIGEHALALFIDEESDGVVVKAAPEETNFEAAAGTDEILPWRKEKDLGDAMPWLAANKGATAAASEYLPSPAPQLAKASSGFAHAADAIFAKARADIETAALPSPERNSSFAQAGAEDEDTPRRDEKDLGDALPWRAAGKAGGAKAIGAPGERTGPWAVQATQDPRAIPGSAGSGPASRPELHATPAGAVAAEGGWFADVMLAALQSYERSVTLSDVPRIPAGGVRN